MENQRRLTFVAQRPKWLLIELEDKVLLSFSGRPEVGVTATDHPVAGRPAGPVSSAVQPGKSRQPVWAGACTVQRHL